MPLSMQIAIEAALHIAFYLIRIGVLIRVDSVVNSTGLPLVCIVAI